MRQGRHHRAALPSPVPRDFPETFFRLCHHCLFLNESEREIQQCQKCEQRFSSPEDEIFENSVEENEESEERGPPPKKTSLTGLDVKW